MAASFPLRRGGPADAPAIAALVESAYGKWVPVIGRPPLPMLVDYGKAVVEHRIDLLEIDGQLAGLVELETEPDCLVVVNLAVAPGFQMRGLGSLLLAHADQVARQSGLGRIRLFTNSLMTSNIALYGRRGYTKDRVEQRSPGWAVVHMSKRVSG
ncbi:MAG TPA: GNAT family N-acetyltransferase [Devosia sp.]|jgi:N-acetylglutamate synthase-like GNAT family acetyltransferase|nr:GNAT family N-acetyltransferase [Devosia sp.]